MICKYGAMVNTSAGGLRKCRFGRPFGRKSADRGKPATVGPGGPGEPWGEEVLACRCRTGQDSGTSEVLMAIWNFGTGPLSRSNSIRRSNAVERMIG